VGCDLVYERFVLWYLLFVMGEEQVANNPTAEIVRCTLGPTGPLAVNSTSKELSISGIEKNICFFHLNGRRRCRRVHLVDVGATALHHVAAAASFTFHARRAAAAASSTSHARRVVAAVAAPSTSHVRRAVALPLLPPPPTRSRRGLSRRRSLLHHPYV
jgi:hypothetical protein